MSEQRVRVSFSRNSDSSFLLRNSSERRDIPAAALDIGSLVERYRRLREVLFPFQVAWDASLYVIRWENYPLTAVTTVALCLLLYNPSQFLACLMLLAIATMTVGKYYSSTKSLSLLKTRESPNVEQLNQDLQELQHIEREQIHSHLLLIEYKQIIQNVERYFIFITNFLDYFYRIIVWKSSEVSLCVTVLLCVCLVLVSTVHLRVIACSVPLLLLCLNTHFLSKTVDLWRMVGIAVWSRVRLKRNPTHKELSTDSHLSSEREPAEVRSDVPPVTNGRCEEQESSNQHEEIEESSTTTLPVTDTELSSSNQPLSGATLRDSPRPHRTDGAPARCMRCQATFTMLKRKHVCANCGYLVCASCTVKKKRAFLGATAPAAFESSVRVCNDCRKYLENINKIEEERRKEEERKGETDSIL